MQTGITNGLGYFNNPVAGKSTLGKDDFLKLMLTQMKSQDPLNPMESTEFAAQLAQFSSLEQLLNLNDQMKTSIDANFYFTQSINNTLAATFIGKEAKLSTNNFQFNGQETQTLGYRLDSRATNVTIKIYNEDGALVKTIENAPANAGDNKLSWDFTDNNGNTVPYGKYRFEVEAVDAKDNPINASKYVLGKIGGVRFTEFGTKLLINGTEFNLSDILEIYEPSSGGN